MARSEDIVAISIPFSAGVGAAAVISARMESPGYWAAASCMCAAAVLLPLLCGKGRRTICAAALYFSLGMCCLFTASACGWSGPHLFDSAASRARSRLIAAIRSAGFSPERTSPLLVALLTGVRDGLDPVVTESFRRSGASHILALSGLHLGILYGFAGKALSWMGRSRPAQFARSAVIISLAFGYTLLTGRGPSITRAFLFICINEISRFAPGRRHGILHNFCISLLIQLIINPLIIKSLAFQLSYLAMLGTLLLHPWLEAFYPRSSRFDPMRRIWKAASLSVSCQAFTAPLVWIRFRSFPLYFLLSNLISLPLTEALIYCAMATMLLKGMGVDAEITRNLAERLGQALIYCLDVISEI